MRQTMRDFIPVVKDLCVSVFHTFSLSSSLPSFSLVAHTHSKYHSIGTPKSSSTCVCPHSFSLVRSSYPTLHRFWPTRSLPLPVPPRLILPHHRTQHFPRKKPFLLTPRRLEVSFLSSLLGTIHIPFPLILIRKDASVRNFSMHSFFS
jgi:hypothetical protein